MVFSSLTFLYGFLPLVMVFYFLWKNRTYRNMVLLVFSLCFYSWGEPRHIFLMLLASGIAYLGGLLLHRLREKRRAKKCVFTVTVALLVLNLVYFKYFNFLAENLSRLFSKSFSLQDIALPIGISFYTFQILSYVIDLYRGEIEVQKNYLSLTLYVSFFPQLIAGPIVRYQTIEEALSRRQESWEGVVSGFRRFTVGLAKKVILANNIALVATTVYSGDSSVYGTAFYWLAALAYAMQIYFDFSGYSDMAIGLGKIFGFQFLENFNYPYLALSITDFWRRWHISLSTWFRDYIYIPLGGNRVGKWKQARNLLLVWGLTGFWHGAQWNFLLWGLYYGVLLLLEKFVWGRLLEKLPKALQWCYAFFLVLLGWVLFNFTELPQLFGALQVMFSFQPTQWMQILTRSSSLLQAMFYLPLGLCFLFPVFKKGLQRFPWKNTLALSLLRDLGYLALFALCVLYIISSTYNPFIYFRF